MASGAVEVLVGESNLARLVAVAGMRVGEGDAVTVFAVRVAVGEEVRVETSVAEGRDVRVAVGEGVAVSVSVTVGVAELSPVLGITISGPSRPWLLTFQR